MTRPVRAGTPTARRDRGYLPSGPTGVRAPRLRPTARSRAVAFVRRRWELLLVSAIALDFVWMRFIDMQTSFWGDEAGTAVLYVDRGLGGIYSDKLYQPNNHVLYSILSWLTVSVLGRHEPAYRIWSVLPAIASAAAMFWWTRQRIGRVAAFALGGFLLAAPILLQWTIEARGYGMAQLGMVMTLIAVAEIEERGPRRAWLALLGAGIIVGAGAYYASASGLGLATLWLMRRRDLRLPVLKAAGIGAIGVLIIQGPLIGAIIRTAPLYQHEFKAYGVKGLITGPVELGTDIGQLLFTGSYFRACGAQCYTTGQLAEWGWPVFVAAALGAAFLWRRRQRGLLGCLTVPLIGTFVFLIVTQIKVDDRFLLFLLPPYLVLAATGVSAAFNYLHMRFRVWPVLAVLAAVVLVLGAGRIYKSNQMLADAPANDFKGLADAYAGTGMRSVVTNMPAGIGFGLQWYFGDHVKFDQPAAVQSYLCGTSGPLAFIQGVDPLNAKELSCLQRQHAAAEDFPGGGNTLLRLWLVSTPGTKRFQKRAGA